MSKSISILFFLCLVHLFLAGQAINKTKVTLPDSAQISFRKTVILIETDSIIISTPYKILLKYLVSKIKTNNYVRNECDSIYQVIRQDTGDKIKVPADKFSSHLKERLNYIIGDLLQSGKYFAFNKITKRRVKKINIIDYGGYWDGTTGKKYYLDKILVLDNIEIVF